MKIKTINKIFLSIFALIISSSLYAELPEGFNIPEQDIGGPWVYSIEIPDDPKIEHYIKEYESLGGQKTMISILKRGAPYLGFIYNKLIEQGLPPELMYLPAIESGFISKAVSRSGASGFWQFMMNSIYPYDMEVNEWRDDRRDFWIATESAIHKLQLNYEQTGSWTLALAAYNCGLGRVKRAVKAAGTTDYIELYELGYLPKQTRNYVPKFFAFTYLASRSASLNLKTAQFLDMQSTRESDKWERIKLDRVINLVMLSSKSGIPLSIINSANAELREGITPPNSNNYYLKIPLKYSETVKNTLSKPQNSLMHFYIHEIRDGDTLYALSRHFGVTVSMIQMYNPGAKASSLRTGQKIIVPALKEVEPYNPEYKAPEQWSSFISYTIASGDTLWSISRKFGTTVADISYNNKLSPKDTLKPGAIIKVPKVTNNEE
ncbi:MAG: LysM peptidoglycan-binding domain-containing protein [Spirochaetales bacterium]|nr:LysM peptidoglycan-binding domain-containing protein [Spirochaetales bacterium]